MKMNGKELFALMGKLDDRYINASAYIAEGSEETVYERPARRRAAAFFQSGWFVAILCAVVSLSVVSAIVWAGRQEPWTPPIAATEQESGSSVDSDELLPGEVRVETEVETTVTVETKTKVSVVAKDCCGQPYTIEYYIHYGYSYPVYGKNSSSFLQPEYEVFYDSVIWQSFYLEFSSYIKDGEHRIRLENGDWSIKKSFATMDDAIAYADVLAKSTVHTDYTESEAIYGNCAQGGVTKGIKCTACGEIFSGCELYPATGKHSVGDMGCEGCGYVTPGLTYTSNGDGTCYLSGFANDDPSLTWVLIPQRSPDGDQIVGIGDGVFEGCANIEKFLITRDLQWIGDSTFKGCIALTSFEIPYYVTSIGKEAFMGCTGLTSIELMLKTEYLGARAFANCTSLKRVSLGAKMDVLAEETFLNCTSLTSVSFTYINVSGIYGVQTIGKGAFRGCTSLSHFNMPKYLKNIEEEAFEGCKSLRSVYFFGREERFGANCFEDCPLEWIRIQASKAYWDSIEKGENWYHGQCTLTVNYNTIPDISEDIIITVS